MTKVLSGFRWQKQRGGTHSCHQKYQGTAEQKTKQLGAPGETRTPNRLIRSQMLYPLSYGRLGLQANGKSRARAVVAKTRNQRSRSTSSHHDATPGDDQHEESDEYRNHCV